VKLLHIAEHAGLSQPTTANIVKTLVQKNYLEQVGRNIGYRLGVAAYQLTGIATYGLDIADAAREPMQELTRTLKETSLIATIRNHKRVILHMEECDQVLQVKTVMIAEVYSTSTGRLLLAFLPEKEVENLIKAVGLPSKKIWPGADTRAGLYAALQKIKEDEYVQTTTVYHTMGFAVPVYNKKQVIASLSVFIPESRYSEANKSKITKLLNSTAKKIKENFEGIN
jgi:DNA-binding IclR family transcriptional regulator